MLAWRMNTDHFEVVWAATSSIERRSLRVRIVSRWVNQRKSELNSAWSLEIVITEENVFVTRVECDVERKMMLNKEMLRKENRDWVRSESDLS